MPVRRRSHVFCRVVFAPSMRENTVALESHRDFGFFGVARSSKFDAHGRVAKRPFTRAVLALAELDGLAERRGVVPVVAPPDLEGLESQARPCRSGGCHLHAQQQVRLVGPRHHLFDVGQRGHAPPSKRLTSRRELARCQPLPVVLARVAPVHDAQPGVGRALGPRWAQQLEEQAELLALVVTRPTPAHNTRGHV